ncbi:MAG: hypothetical protein WAW85_06390 [Gordonia sp. (in: high G+C Gram-positive bacteria)]|uniref:hypothetical protein n=1 Tax=Gordonia sp. (in: high G+C Gram-positive bacteria) TaxID=84139 RepID=UPI003BB7FDBF
MADDDLLLADLRRARVDDDPGQTSTNVQRIAEDLSRSDMERLARILRKHPDVRHASADVSAEWFVRRQPAEPSGGAKWDEYITEWLTSLRDGRDNDAFEIVFSAIVWRIRSTHPDVLVALPLSQVLAEKETSSPDFDTNLSIVLQAARFDFNFERIEQILAAVGESVTNSSLYYRAMLQYSRLGRGKHVTTEDIRSIAKDTQSEKILSLLLHGLWFTADREYAEEMLTIAKRLIVINKFNPVTYMRQASAFRRTGQYPEAIRAINLAIRLHPPNDREAHNDLKLERVTIAIQHDAKLRLEAEIRERLEREGARQRAKLNELTARTNDQLSDSLFKVVEILGVFSAIIGVIATVVAGNATAREMEWWQRLLIVVAGGLSVLAFFWLLRVIVRPPTRPVDDLFDDADRELVQPDDSTTDSTYEAKYRPRITSSERWT